jgi:16S rRNA (cytosine967-C5)-methyltransferase
MNPRQLAFETLRAIQRGSYADVALERALRGSDLAARDRGLATELVYGSVRQQRTLDALIDQLAKKPAHQQHPDLRLILHLGFYQLRYLTQIPMNAAVSTAVDLTKQNGLAGLSGLVNGILRQYIRQTGDSDILSLPEDPVARLGLTYSYPDWLIQLWLGQLGEAETHQLCQWFNQAPQIDLRINPRQTSLAEVEAAFQARDILVQRLPHLPQALRLVAHAGAISQLPGFEQGWWTVQDASAQWVSQWLAPQPGEFVIDACAAPGGKTTHLAELMADQGQVLALDCTESRLRKLEQNRARLGLKSIRVMTADSQQSQDFVAQADRVLVDAPCSGLGTLHRHADARWRQTPDSIAALTTVQLGLLTNAATWVKPGGHLVYSTCTLHPQENQTVVEAFLGEHPEWQRQSLSAVPDLQADSQTPLQSMATPAGDLQFWPHRQQMDGFFMAHLVRQA